MTSNLLIFLAVIISAIFCSTYFIYLAIKTNTEFQIFVPKMIEKKKSFPKASTKISAIVASVSSMNWG